MKKVPVILAVVLGIVDAALVVFLVLMLLQPKFGAGGEETAGTEPVSYTHLTLPTKVKV